MLFKHLLGGRGRRDDDGSDGAEVDGHDGPVFAGEHGAGLVRKSTDVEEVADEWKRAGAWWKGCRRGDWPPPEPAVENERQS